MITYTLDDLKNMPYKEYLKTEHWQKQREESLSRAKYKCQLCSKTEELNVHHNTYKNRGCEESEDLIVLCRKCHSKFHNKEINKIKPNEKLENDSNINWVRDYWNKKKLIEDYYNKNKKYIVNVIENYIGVDMEEIEINKLFNELFEKTTKNIFKTTDITDLIAKCHGRGYATASRHGENGLKELKIIK